MFFFSLSDVFLINFTLFVKPNLSFLIIPSQLLSEIRVPVHIFLFLFAIRVPLLVAVDVPAAGGEDLWESLTPERRISERRSSCDWRSAGSSTPEYLISSMEGRRSWM